MYWLVSLLFFFILMPNSLESISKQSPKVKGKVREFTAWFNDCNMEKKNTQRAKKEAQKVKNCARDNSSHS